MKFAEINRLFTNTVSKWIAKGYIINTTSMSGSQGEIAKIDLTNGEEVIRILLERFNKSERIENFHYSYSGIKIAVGRATDNITPNSTSVWDTVWNSNLEILSSEYYYQIGDENRHGDRWFGTKGDSMLQQVIHYDRYITRHVSDCRELSSKTKSIVLPFIKRQPKSKSTRLSDISKVMKIRDHYIVKAKGKRFVLK